MERLSIDEVIEHCKRHTERMESHSGRMQLEETPIGNSNIMKQYWEHRQVAEWLEQLKFYKDAEGQGLLLRLPCKVGDTIYAIKEKWDEEFFSVPKPVRVFEIKVCHEENITKYFINGYWYFNDFGKTVFLTKEEAEQALVEMKRGVRDGCCSYGVKGSTSIHRSISQTS